ncbi:lysine N(6)-hydroxylase/L-ornithine N(5)-oxygenase family protein [Pseudomonas aeruginosa]|uniref:lysine N(6)-hydroxylase/L-ornithine N(5)-oxygenase family protein n=1 Tax=Pseudomonas aeruginosa TaxID=287 RepID=UPI003CC5E782
MLDEKLHPQKRREKTMNTSSDHAPVALAGIGVGPANLSLAALLHPHPQITSAFFDQRSEFHWHPGLMLPNSTVQISFMKDLVSLVDPTSKLSFLAYLAKQRRLLCFINANFTRVLRREFNEYYRWACSQLTNLHFGRSVEAVTVENGVIALHGSSWRRTAKNLVLGTGLQPAVPECARPWLGATLFHASQFLTQNTPVKDKRVVVIGGGQTGAEIFQHLISDTAVMPASVTWVSRRANYLPLDESNFTNEFYTPEYSDYFYRLSESQRRQLLAEQKLASDGVSTVLLELIYRRLYELRYVLQHPCATNLSPGRTLTRVDRRQTGWRLSLNHILHDSVEVLDADIVVLCTGYAYDTPPCLAPIADRIRRSDKGEFLVNEDYSIDWVGPAECRIYVQNAARVQRGIADPNLSLTPWRSAIIINSVARRKLYDVVGPAPMINWQPQ